jgi:hypothetical protein
VQLSAVLYVLLLAAAAAAVAVDQHVTLKVINARDNACGSWVPRMSWQSLGELKGHSNTFYDKCVGVVRHCNICTD